MYCILFFCQLLICELVVCGLIEFDINLDDDCLNERCWGFVWSY